MINSEPVCAPVFAASIGVSEAVISRMRKRVVDGCVCAYDDDGPRSTVQMAASRETSKWMSVVAWVTWHGKTAGDHSPERSATILPCIPLESMWKECKVDQVLLGKPEDCHASESYFKKVWRTDPSLAKYEKSTLKLNFQRCYTCTKIAAAIANSKTLAERDHWRERRTVHLYMCRQERMSYEANVERATRDEITLLAIDGWSKWSSTVPHCNGQIHDLSGTSVLPIKVTGCIVHGRPGDKMVKFYMTDPTLPADTNLNCEVVRRALCDIVDRGGSIKSEVHIQADNAGVCCCWAAAPCCSTAGCR